jgi:two-component sensor histidine kinase
VFVVSVLGGDPAALTLPIKALSNDRMFSFAALESFLLLAAIPFIGLGTHRFGLKSGVLTASLFAVLAFSFAHSDFDVSRADFTAIAIYGLAAGAIIWLIHNLSEANRNLRDDLAKVQGQLAQQHILFHDLQHRVANNMQFVASILTMQKRLVKGDPAAAASALDEARDRLVNMSIIHRRLYDPGRVRMPLRNYLQDLCLDLINASTAKNIICRVESDALAVDPNKLVALSLIVTELVTNSLKHGFDAEETGEIAVTLKAADKDQLVLTVSDSGRGLPANFDPYRKNGQGFQIMQALTHQINGALEFSSGSDFVVRLTFPA